MLFFAHGSIVVGAVQPDAAKQPTRYQNRIEDSHAPVKPDTDQCHLHDELDRLSARYFGCPAGAFGAELVEAASHSQASARRERSFEKLPRLNDPSYGAS